MSNAQARNRSLKIQVFYKEKFDFHRGVQQPNSDFHFLVLLFKLPISTFRGILEKDVVDGWTLDYYLRVYIWRFRVLIVYVLF